MGGYAEIGLARFLEIGRLRNVSRFLGGKRSWPQVIVKHLHGGAYKTNDEGAGHGRLASP